VALIQDENQSNVCFKLAEAMGNLGFFTLFYKKNKKINQTFELKGQ
jgi:hypothetical protein